MKKIGIVITDGVGFRNFMLSDFLAEAESNFDEVVILSCLPAAVFAGLSGKAKVIELTVFQEKFITWFFRKNKELAHLQLHKKDNFGIQDNLKANYSRANNPRGFATRFAFWWTTLFHSEKWIQRYNRFQQQSFKNHPITQEYLDILQKENFDLLFVTHQRPPFVAPLIYAAEKSKVKTTAFIFSWDNLASKNRMAGNFDYYLVWSGLMKKELLHFYSGITPESVEIVGTPQFEPYVLDRYKSSKEAFCHKFGINPSLKTICFSCGDISTSRNDELYIETIAKAISAKIIDNVNFIVRTSPAEDPIRFAAFVDKFPFIKWNYPKWNLSREGHQETWSQRVPSIEDVSDLRALIEFSDLNINMLSTMSLDFMQFDKPVINTVFGNKENDLYDDQRFLAYAHIENVVTSESTRIVKNEQELIESIRLYLANPGIDAENRKQFNQLQVGRPLQGTSKHIAETLKKWANP
ncbi:hypothetical protein EZL74_07685 [Flavobacterium silvisoli]|uniref:UDP-glycosyltransferase n=1 Tax=Flavobacterium silvisoli TaxID=2529433 RepID=A0A4Q9Z497_9FLAO|nr:hypothetical protein [Flavobacterium silvisoli]TBX69246.1 hypothetical protein EZL74_07685 [Flavobacterium silvisoli]